MKLHILTPGKARVSDDIVSAIINVHEQLDSLHDVRQQCTSTLQESKDLINTLLADEKLTENALQKIEMAVIHIELQLTAIGRRRTELTSILDDLHSQLDTAIEEEQIFSDLLTVHPARLN